jgi:hypothetical protein
VWGCSGEQARLDLACVELMSEVEPRGRRSWVGENGKAARAKRGCGFPPRGKKWGRTGEGFVGDLDQLGRYSLLVSWFRGSMTG